jgi:radical SAM superfamily enzyme YgiQ (UPF0313 family)
MRVLFSNPPWWQGSADHRLAGGQTAHLWTAGVRAGSRWPHTTVVRRSPDKFVFGDYLPYPFFMGHAATYAARATGAEIVFRDSIALSESTRSYLAFIDEHHFDYIFIESATPSWGHDGQLVRMLAQRYPKTKLVLTGPLAIEGKRLMEAFPLHACIRGEYEKGAVKVIGGAEGLIDFDLLTPDEMNAAPFPYFDPVIAHRYWDCNPKGQVAPHAQIWSSRGCPYKCIFCVWPATMTGNDPEGAAKRTVRFYSADYLEAFISDLAGRYGFRSIYFDDDTFNLGDPHVEKVCAVMRKIGLPWSAMCRADTIKRETWKLMRESGCFGVKIGVESGNQQVLDTIVNKRLDLDVVREIVPYLKSIGMNVHGTFTYGLPGETASQMADTKRLIAQLPFDSIQESGTAEIEGTPLASLALKGKLERYEGAKLDRDYVRASDGSKKIATLSSGHGASEGSAPRPHSGQVLYCDKGLADNNGHFANNCRQIAGEMRRRGVPLRIFAARHIVPSLAAELGAEPFFSPPSPQMTSTDPLAGWLENFFAHAKLLGEDLAALPKLGPNETLYWNSAEPATLLALIEWMQDCYAPETCPRIVIEFGFAPGLVRRANEDGQGFHHDLLNQEPYLYRFAIRKLKAEYRPHLRLGAFDPATAEAYADLLGFRVFTIPLPQTAPRPPRLRTGKRPITVALLGHQRPDKGFHFAPPLIGEILRAHPESSALIHNGGMFSMLPEMNELKQMARREPRIAIRHEPADAALWQDLLDACDLILLPYDPGRFANSYSAIVADALANAIPMVLPAETSLSRMAKSYGDSAISFASWDLDAIYAAADQALGLFDELAAKALEASKRWQASHNPARTVDSLLGGGEEMDIDLGGADRGAA